MERNVYSKHSRIGILLMLAIDLALFGPWGLAVWAVQMIWIPLTAAGIINGLGHYYGYRNFDTDDRSTNIIPWGIVIGGEELHNNHHKSPASAKLSARMFEFDIGWLYIKIFSLIGLATVR
jgi:stearoyl-CoA desaturase (delta-9 desaturase)